LGEPGKRGPDNTRGQSSGVTGKNNRLIRGKKKQPGWSSKHRWGTNHTQKKKKETENILIGQKNGGKKPGIFNPGAPKKKFREHKSVTFLVKGYVTLRRNGERGRGKTQVWSDQLKKRKRPAWGEQSTYETWKGEQSIRGQREGESRPVGRKKGAASVPTRAGERGENETAN